MIIDCIKQIDWSDSENKKIASTLIADAEEYMERVVSHIYKGNEIRADSFMDISEKQDEIERLDRKRTEAHNNMLKSFGPFLDILIRHSDFDKDDYKLGNRTQIADFVALVVFEMLNEEPNSRTEGNIRDCLAEKLQSGEITYEQINSEIRAIKNNH